MDILFYCNECSDFRNLGNFLFSHLLLKKDSALWRQVIQAGMKICLLEYDKSLAKYFLMF